MQQTLQTDPLAPFYLGCARSHRPLPRGFTGHVTYPIRSIVSRLRPPPRPLPRGFTGHVAHPIRSIAVCRTSIADDLSKTKFQL
jgi:hypothetical protein